MSGTDSRKLNSKLLFPRNSHSPAAPGGRQRRRRIQFGRHDAHHVPARVHQRPARIARLHRQADLKIARVIRRARQRRDFLLASPVK
jgi:hypothetical protein